MFNFYNDTILLNFCKIKENKLKYIIDDSPFRYNKFMPGVKIPIYDFKYFKNDLENVKDSS